MAQLDPTTCGHAVRIAHRHRAVLVVKRNRGADYLQDLLSRVIMSFNQLGQEALPETPSGIAKRLESGDSNRGRDRCE
jgi:hypothetical protein